MSKAHEAMLKMSDERLVATGLICSVGFCSRIVPLVDLDAFTNRSIRKVVEWSVKYFEEYDEPIYTNIQVKFEEEQKNMDEDESELIQVFLERISKDFEPVKGYFNDAFYITKALDFFRKRCLEALKQKIETCIETGNLDEGFEHAAQVKKIVGDTLKVSRLFDERASAKFFDKERKENGLLRLPGDYGSLLGKLDRGQLISFLAPMKRGKTWFLLHLAYEAIIQNRKVLFISHEMTQEEAEERFYSIITKRSWTMEEGNVVVPQFDCEKNQKGECVKKIRVGGGTFETQQYKPCSVCRTKDRAEYAIAAINKIIPRRYMNERDFYGKMKAFDFMYGNNFRMQCANFSSNWISIKETIETLRTSQEFYPDIIIEDYINIRAPYKFGMGNINKIEMIDMNWRETKAFALAEGLLYVTAHQGTRATIKKKAMDAGDTSGFIDIVAHVNKLFGLNQTMKEKEMGIMRVNTLVNRMEPFSDETFVTVLQNLDMGRVILDSQFGYITKLAKSGKKDGADD